jgi:hypothetical protein
MNSDLESEPEKSSMVDPLDGDGEDTEEEEREVEEEEDEDEYTRLNQRLVIGLDYGTTYTGIIQRRSI